MIARLLVIPFGSMWRLKALCVSARPRLLRKLFRWIYQVYNYENSSSIAWNAYFEGPPCLPHGLKSIFVSGGARIGRNCVLFQQVTIGSNTLPDSKSAGSPVLGDSCYVGAGAKIVGNVHIGNNVRIGANAVVTKDVPDNAVVVPAEQRMVVRQEPLDNHFYTCLDGWHYYEDGKFHPVRDKDTILKLASSQAAGNEGTEGGS